MIEAHSEPFHFYAFSIGKFCICKISIVIMIVGLLPWSSFAFIQFQILVFRLIPAGCLLRSGSLIASLCVCAEKK